MLFKKANINEGVEEFRQTPGAILVDVREENEYIAGHIPGAINLPLSTLQTADIPFSEDTPAFIYCLAGTRAGRAASFLQNAGYTNVKNIGGINAYKGPVET